MLLLEVERVIEIKVSRILINRNKIKYLDLNDTVETIEFPMQLALCQDKKLKIMREKMITIITKLMNDNISNPFISIHIFKIYLIKYAYFRCRILTINKIEE